MRGPKFFQPDPQTSCRQRLLDRRVVHRQILPWSPIRLLQKQCRIKAARRGTDSLEIWEDDREDGVGVGRSAPRNKGVQSREEDPSGRPASQPQWPILWQTAAPLQLKDLKSISGPYCQVRLRQ